MYIDNYDFLLLWGIITYSAYLNTKENMNTRDDRDYRFYFPEEHEND